MGNFIESIGLRYAEYAGAVWGTGALLLIVGIGLIVKIVTEDASEGVKIGALAVGVALLALLLGFTTVDHAKEACQQGLLAAQDCYSAFEFEFDPSTLQPSPAAFPG